MNLLFLGEMSAKLSKLYLSTLPKIWRRFNSKLEIDSSQKFSGKVFCIGFNKTGTTSTEKTLKDFGYRLGNQAIAEMLIADWFKKDFRRLIQYCHTSDAFQDAPFSLPNTYQVLDKTFPNSKFILTVRNSKEQWYQSLVNSHTKLFSSDKHRPPNENDLNNALYRYKGFILDSMKMIYNYPEVALYDFVYYTALYEQHNQCIIDYFSNCPEKLLVLNVSKPNAYQDLATFLSIKVSKKAKFPWKNKS